MVSNVVVSADRLDYADSQHTVMVLIAHVQSYEALCKLLHVYVYLWNMEKSCK